VVGTRESLTDVHGKAGELTNDRMAYKHGLGVFASRHQHRADRGTKTLTQGLGISSPGYTSAK